MTLATTRIARQVSRFVPHAFAWLALPGAAWAQTPGTADTPPDTTSVFAYGLALFFTIAVMFIVCAPSRKA